MDQDRQMLMVEDNVGYQFRPNAVQNVRNQVVQNAVPLGIQIVENMNGLSVVLEIANQYGNRNVVIASTEANGNGINGIQNTQEEFEFMAAANAYEETERVKALTSGTQSDKAPVYNSDGSVEGNHLLLLDQKLYAITPLPKSKAIPKIDESHALSKPVTSNSVPTPTKSKVVKNDNVISPGIFRINSFKASRVDNFVPNKHVKPSVRTKPFTVSQPHVITKNDVNSKTNGFSPKDIKITTKNERPLPRNNPKNDKVPSKSKIS
nr:hypothetical protein [Tanacetum cinerariifolium]